MTVRLQEKNVGPMHHMRVCIESISYTPRQSLRLDCQTDRPEWLAEKGGQGAGSVRKGDLAESWFWSHGVSAHGDRNH